MATATKKKATAKRKPKAAAEETKAAPAAKKRPGRKPGTKMSDEHRTKAAEGIKSSWELRKAELAALRGLRTDLKQLVEDLPKSKATAAISKALEKADEAGADYKDA